MKAALLLLLAAAVIDAQSPPMMKKMLRGIDMYNFRAKCWGEKNVDTRIAAMEAAKMTCLQMDSPDLSGRLSPHINPFSSGKGFQHAYDILGQLRRGGDISQLPSLWRSRREAHWDMDDGLLKPDQDDLYQFLGEVQEYKADIGSMMGNLTCVLEKLQMLTPDKKINMEFYTSALTEGTIEGIEFEEGTAFSDPEWRQKMSDCNADCYKLSQNWPQSSLNRNPLTLIFGRHMIFFKCAQKMERKMCAEAQMLEWLTKMYGEKSPEEAAEQREKLGLPEDKYEAAAVATAVMYNAASDEENFVDDFMWNMMGDHM